MMRLFLLLLSFPFFGSSQSCTLKSSLAGKQGKMELTKSEINTLTKIDLASTCGAEKNFNIVSYQLTIIIKNNPILLTGRGNKFEPIKNSLANKDAGAKAFIDNIKAKNKEGKLVSVEGLTIIVK